MILRRIIINLIPNWAVLLATDFRCLLRCALVSRKTRQSNITKAAALVVAPHPDDETFGCAGLIKLKRAAGVPVRVVLLTDGEAVADGLGECPEAVIMARKREAIAACQQLGVDARAVSWLHLPDGKLPHQGQSGFAEAVQALLTEIERCQPGEVYCPHWEDRHADHIAAGQLALESLRLWARPCELFYYPIWMWYHASSGLRKRLNPVGAWRLDITEVLAAKEQAMNAYLEAPKTSTGRPFCGRLPWSFLRNFRRRHEVFFRGNE